MFVTFPAQLAPSKTDDSPSLFSNASKYKLRPTRHPSRVSRRFSLSVVDKKVAGGIMRNIFQKYPRSPYLLLATIILLAPTILRAQGTSADYQRAQSLREKFQGLAVDVPGNATWIEG